MDPKIFFPMTGRVYAIPYWVAATVRRKNKQMSDLLDFKKASEFLSGSELAALHLFNEVGNSTLSIPAIKDFNLFGCFYHTDNEGSENYRAEAELLRKYKCDDTFVPDMTARLYSEINNRSADVSVTSSDPESGFEVVGLRDQAVGVILYNSIAKLRNTNELVHAVLRETVKQLYVYEHPRKVHDTHVYFMYLKTLHLHTPVAA